MNTLQAAVDHYLGVLRNGDFETAFHGLRGLDPAIVPLLIVAYRIESTAQVRNGILRIVSEFRTPASLPILNDAVRDRSATIWKTALDGFVSLASAEAASALELVLREETDSVNPNSEYLEWVREALNQVQDALGRNSHQKGASTPQASPSNSLPQHIQ